MSVKYAFICGKEGSYPVQKMCRWAKVSSSGYYEWRGRGPSLSELRRRRLSVLVEWSFADSDGTYGYRRVQAQLARLGEVADPETIRLIMRDLGLVACQPRPWRPTTTVAGDVSSTLDLVNRDFTSDAPATKLVGDITYIRTWEGWLYLATVLDCHTKQVVGYAMADHMRTSLIIDALAMAALAEKQSHPDARNGARATLDANDMREQNWCRQFGEQMSEVSDQRPHDDVRISYFGRN